LLFVRSHLPTQQVPKLAYNLYNNADGAVTAPFVYVVAGTVLHFLGNGN